MKRLMLVLSAVLLAPLLAQAATSGTAVGQKPSGKYDAWRQDPTASGSLAVHPGDHVAVGRLATASSKQLVIESDWGGNETIALGSETRFLNGIHGADALKSGEVVSVAYQGNGSSRKADAVSAGDFQSPSRMASASSAAKPSGTGSTAGAGK